MDLFLCSYFLDKYHVCFYIIQVNKEIGKVKIDEGTLEHLFETRATELKPKVCNVTILYYIQLALLHYALFFTHII